MKTAGIITLPGYFNYGQRLQHYAVTQLVKQCRCEPESIYFSKMLKAKNKHLKQFTDEHTKSRVITSNRQLNEYDKIIVGSDQVFNYKFKTFKKMDLFNRLKTVDSGKLIAFCASMGFDELPKNLHLPYAKHLERYKAVSVREQSAADIISEISKIEATVLLDPVFYVNWNKLASDRFKGAGKYSFSYYVIGHECLMLYEREGRQITTGLSVPDFLSAIKYADYISTNSYHGACLSIAFNRKAYIIENRPGMNTRFQTLFSIFMPEQLTDTTWVISKGQDREIIQGYKVKAKSFLEGALNDT